MSQLPLVCVDDVLFIFPVCELVNRGLETIGVELLHLFNMTEMIRMHLNQREKPILLCHCSLFWVFIGKHIVGDDGDVLIQVFYNVCQGAFLGKIECKRP
jgi:hypothetical protein